MAFIPPDPSTTEWVPIWNPISEGPVGPQGPQGIQGIQGIQGVKGDTGSQGIQGIQGVPGTPGEMWFAGAGAPAGALAGSVVGDWYLNTTNGDVYEKTGASAWTLRGNLKGPQGDQGIQGTPGEKWFSGTGAPTGGTGIVGDWYLNTANGDVYEKTGASTWTVRGNIRGPQGIQGIQGEVGPQGPIGNTGPQGPQGIQGVPGEATAAHHASHEPGGADYLVNSAWLNMQNVFTTRQYLQEATGAPTLIFRENSRPVDAKVWRLYSWQSQLTFDTVNDAESNILNRPLVLTRAGQMTVTALGTQGPDVGVCFSGETAKARFTKAVPGNRMDITTNLSYPGPATGWMRDDTTKESGLLTIFDDGRLGYYIAHAGANPVGYFDLPFQITVGGRTILTQKEDATGYYGLEVARSSHTGIILNETGMGADAKKWRIHTQSSILYIEPLNDSETAVPVRTLRLTRDGNTYTGGAFFPGIDYAGGPQTSYYLSGNTTYGLFTNTGLYVTSNLRVAGGVVITGGSGTAYTGGPLEIQSGTPRVGLHWPGVVATSIGMDSGGVVRTFDNPGTGYAAFAAASIVANGTFTATGTIGSSTNIWRSNMHTDGGYVYPGYPAVQSSWYIAGNATYGMYINTGLYVAGNIWCGAHGGGAIGTAAMQSGISGYSSTVLFNGVYGVMNFTNGVLTSFG